MRVVQTDEPRRSWLDRLIERSFAVRAMRISHMPNGLDLANDVRRFLPGWAVRTVLDVGAERGGSALHLADTFPHAVIHSFEPEQTFFSAMSARLAGRPNHRLHAVAVGAREEELDLVVGGPRPRVAAAGAEPDRRRVPVISLDAFCARHEVASVGFLKVDTEGHDLEVLRGAEALLSAQRIDLVQVEASMSPHNRFHAPFAEFSGHLEERGYLLFGVYDQLREFDGRPQLRRANPVFISATLAESVRWR